MADRLHTGFWLSASALLLGTVMACQAADSALPEPAPAVTLTLRHVSVAEACAALSRSSGVQLEPGSREIGDYKLHLLLRGAKLSDVLEGITRIFSPPGLEGTHFWLKERKNNRLVYRLSRSADFESRLEALRQRPLRSLQERLELLARWADLSPAQQAEAARAHPVVSHLAQSPAETSLARLFLTDPRSGPVLRSGGRWKLEYATAGPAQRQVLDQLHGYLTSRGKPGAPMGDVRESSVEFFVKGSSAQPILGWKVPLGTREQPRWAIGTLGEAAVSLPSGRVSDGPDGDPAGSSGWTGNPPAPSPREGASGKVEGVRYLFDGLKAVHESTGANLIANARTERPLPCTFVAEGAAEGQLDTLGRKYRFAFSRANSLITGGDTRWAYEFDREVPVRLLLPWAQRKEAAGRLDLDDLAEMAQLPAAQQERLLISFPEAIPGGNRALALWATLTPEQRQAARTSDGLRFPRGHRELIPAGWQLRAQTETVRSDGADGTPAGALREQVRLIRSSGASSAVDSVTLAPVDRSYKATEIRN